MDEIERKFDPAPSQDCSQRLLKDELLHQLGFGEDLLLTHLAAVIKVKQRVAQDV